MGRRPWGYMHGDAMEVGAVWSKSWGGGRRDICMRGWRQAGGGEEERRRRGGEEEEVGASFEI